MSELNYWERIKKLSLFSLQRRREWYIILHMWKILNLKNSNDISTEFFFRPRLGNLAKIPVCKKSSSALHWTAYERLFAVLGPKLWNCILYSIHPQQHSKYELLQDAVHWVLNVCSRYPASSRLHSNKLELPTLLA